MLARFLGLGQCLGRVSVAGAARTLRLVMTVIVRGTTLALHLEDIAAAPALLAGTDAAPHPHLVAVTALSMENITLIPLDAGAETRAMLEAVGVMTIVNAVLLDDAAVPLRPLARTPTCHRQVPSSSNGTIQLVRATSRS